MKPGVILTSMLKAVDVAVYDTIKMTQAGQFTAGTVRFGLKNKGVDYTFDQYNQKILTADIRQKTDELKKQIIAGTIKVPDYYLKGK
jgi:basic membrane protein A